MDAAGNVQGLKKALGNIRSLKVADYQRDYSWGPEDIEALWSDIKLVLDGDSTDDHFMGTLIFQRIDEKSQHFELVDGQQRMTTIFLFMVALLDQSKMHGIRSLNFGGRTFNVAQEIESFLLGEPDSNGRPGFNQARLIPLPFLQKVFSSITDTDLNRDQRLKAVPRVAKKGDPFADITLPIRRAYNLVDKLINEHFDELKRGSDAHLEEVNKVRRAFMEQLKVLTIHTDDLEDSLDVFMTLNNRGTPLGVFDLFRGETLKARIDAADPASRDGIFQECLDEWKGILQNLKTYSADKYLRHFALLKNRDLEKKKPKPLTMKKIPAWASEYISGATSPSMAAQKIWEQVALESENYGYFLRPSDGRQSDYYLESMRLIGESYRVLLLGVKSRDEDIWNEKSRINLYSLVYRLMVKWQLSGGNAQELEGKFQLWAQEFIDNEEPSALLSKLEKEGSHVGINLEGRLKETAPLDENMAKSMLLLLEARMTPQSTKIDLQEVQLEHIAPQTRTSHWESVIGSDYSNQITRLGNLAILDRKINAKIKQATFVDKKEEYKKSRLRTVEGITSQSEWNLAVINQRQLWLATELSQLIEDSSHSPQLVTSFN